VTTPLRVAVLAHDGTLLGYVTRAPTGPSWRALGNLPRIRLGRGGAFPVTRECNGTEGEWWVKLYEGETPPANLATPESVG
jgi:hypothetical protein